MEYTQSLYEKKLVTYPRTDSQFLTEDMADTAEHMLDEEDSCFIMECFEGKGEGKFLDALCVRYGLSKKQANTRMHKNRRFAPRIILKRQKSFKKVEMQSKKCDHRLYRGFKNLARIPEAS